MKRYRLTREQIDRACSEARKRVSKMSWDERRALWERGMAVINGSASENLSRIHPKPSVRRGSLSGDVHGQYRKPLPR